MRFILPFLFCLFFSDFSMAQPPEGHDVNLVPNPDFESLHGKRPEDDIDGSGIFRYNVEAWKSPTRTTPDLRISLPAQIKKMKQNYGIDDDKAHSGYKMVGILTHNPESRRDDTYREYIQVKLNKALKKGTEYYCEFWVCRARLSKYITNNIGVALTPTWINGDGFKPLTNIVPDYNYDQLINEEKREWQRISFTFTAKDRYEVLCIGNFFDNESTNMVLAKDRPEITADEKAFNNSYYLIDDVMLCATQVEPEPLPEPEPPKVGAVIKLDRVFFETAKWALLPESFEQLNELRDLMNEYPSMEIEIHGHTDSRGGDSYNQNLSENRTKSVFEYLVEQGIADSRMKYIGYGEMKPIADNETPDGRQLNRRVEFVVVKIDAENTTIEQSNEVKPYTDND